MLFLVTYVRPEALLQKLKALPKYALEASLVSSGPACSLRYHHTDNTYHKYILLLHMYKILHHSQRLPIGNDKANVQH